MKTTMILSRLFLALLFCLSTVSISSAQDSIRLPEDAKFSVQIKIDELLKTKVGEHVLQMVLAQAKKELGLEEDFLPHLEETIGFSPTEELKTLTIVGASFDDDNPQGFGLLAMGKTTGNLEGLLLAVPGYKAEEYNGQTIYSFAEEEIPKVSLMTLDNDQKVIAAGIVDGSTKAAIDSLGLNSGSSDSRSLTLELPEGTLAQVVVIDLPEEIREEAEKESFGHIIEMIENLTLSVQQTGSDQLSVSLEVHIVDEKKAELVQQLAQGAQAAMKLMEKRIMEQPDKEAKFFLSLLKDLTVSRTGNVVILTTLIDQEMLLKILVTA